MSASEVDATRRDLLERVQTGDVSALEQLFALHRAFLCRVIERRMDVRVRARVDPSDVVQETQLEVFRRLPEFLQRDPMPFRLWLIKTANERLSKVERFHLAAERRSSRREVPLPDRSSLALAQQLVASGMTASQRLARHEMVDRIRQVLTELSELDREIILLRTLEALSNDEAACLLEIEPAAAMKRYSRALIRLNKLLSQRGIRESQL